jgi:hypothetical protein
LIFKKGQLGAIGNVAEKGVAGAISQSKTTKRKLQAKQIKLLLMLVYKHQDYVPEQGKKYVEPEDTMNTEEFFFIYIWCWFLTLLILLNMEVTYVKQNLVE